MAIELANFYYRNFSTYKIVRGIWIKRENKNETSLITRIKVKNESRYFLLSSSSIEKMLEAVSDF